MCWKIKEIKNTFFICHAYRCLTFTIFYHILCVCVWKHKHRPSSTFFVDLRVKWMRIWTFANLSYITLMLLKSHFYPKRTVFFPSFIRLTRYVLWWAEKRWLTIWKDKKIGINVKTSASFIKIIKIRPKLRT